MAGGSSADWRGRKVLDRDGDKLGKLEAVYLDRQSDEPKWGLVNGGPFRASKLVPLGEASDDGKELRIPVARGRVKRASEASGGEGLSAREESELDDHYGTTSSGGRPSEAPPQSDHSEERDMASEHRGDGSRQREPEGDRSGHAEREQHGGFKIGAAIIGWLIAVVLAVILTALAGAITALVGADTGAPAAGSTAVAAIVGAVVVLLVLGLAYFVGGYVAGRMARFNGPKQGLGVWVIGAIVTIVLAIAGALFGSQFDVLAQLNLPSIPLDLGTVGIGALISLVLIALVTLLAAMGGGKLGTRFHRKVDRVGARA